MFDQLVATTAGTSGAGAVDAWTRVEAAACARRLAAMVTMLDDAYAASDSADRDQWCLDNWGAVCAHVGAAQRITSGAASNLLIVATALRDRFPKVAAVFAEGLIGYPLVRTIVTRGALVQDPDALAAVDTALAAALRTWEPMSVEKTEQTIDAFIAQVDPHAVRRTHTAARGRSIDITVEDGSGLATLFGTLFTPNAKALDTRLNALADTVCPADPRTKDQRRSDALGALAVGAERLPCLCDTNDCTATLTPPSTEVVVYVIAHQDTLESPAPDVPPRPEPDDDSTPEDPPQPDEHPAPEDPDEEYAALDGTAPPMLTKPLREVTLTEALTPAPGYVSTIRPAVLMCGGFLPGPIARRAAQGATIRTIVHPGQAPPEPRHTPSKKLAEFVRCRGLTCRFPGCTQPATNCDLDHTIPWPYGATGASNLKCLCRFHHLLKTFWVGNGGWRDKQEPDGTVIWTASDGRTHTTTPGSRLLFPELSGPTAPIVATGTPTAHTAGLTMPRRRTTRIQDRARRISDERETNRTATEEDEKGAAAARAVSATEEDDPSEDALPQSDDAPF